MNSIHLPQKNTGNPKEDKPSPYRDLEYKIDICRRAIFVSFFAWIVFSCYTLGQIEGNSRKINFLSTIQEKMGQKFHRYSNFRKNNRAKVKLNSAWDEFITGNYHQSLAYCNEAILLNPRLGSAYALRGCINESVGKNHEALDDINSAIKLDHANKKVYLAVKRNMVRRIMETVSL